MPLTWSIGVAVEIADRRRDCELAREPVAELSRQPFDVLFFFGHDERELPGLRLVERREARARIAQDVSDDVRDALGDDAR